MKIFTDAIAMGAGAGRGARGRRDVSRLQAASYVNGHMLHVDGGVADVLSLPVAVSS